MSSDGSPGDHSTWSCGDISVIAFEAPGSNSSIEKQRLKQNPTTKQWLDLRRDNHRVDEPIGERRAIQVEKGRKGREWREERGMGQGGRQRGERDRQTETKDTEKQRQTDSETHTQKQRDGDIERDRDREMEISSITTPRKGALHVV